MRASFDERKQTRSSLEVTLFLSSEHVDSLLSVDGFDVCELLLLKKGGENTLMEKRTRQEQRVRAHSREGEEEKDSLD